jgi:hypothetical protein
MEITEIVCPERPSTIGSLDEFVDKSLKTERFQMQQKTVGDGKDFNFIVRK